LGEFDFIDIIIEWLVVLIFVETGGVFIVNFHEEVLAFEESFAVIDSLVSVILLGFVAGFSGWLDTVVILLADAEVEPAVLGDFEFEVDGFMVLLGHV
jgi:hypothetical protein